MEDTMVDAIVDSDLDTDAVKELVHGGRARPVEL
jgi:hypothetical protein